MAIDSSITTETGEDNHQVIILAPYGRDAAVLQHTLASSGIAATKATGVPRLHDLGALVLTQEAFVPGFSDELAIRLSSQPAWSDLPMLLLCDAEPASTDRAAEMRSLQQIAANLVILARPVRAITLVSAVRTALRARHRQFELRALMQREQDARARAEQALRVRDEFLAMVSHELRTPLGAILLWTRLLKEGLDEQGVARALLAIEQSAQAQSRLTEDLLDASRIKAGQLKLNVKTLDMAALVEATLNVVRPTAEIKGITIEPVLAPSVLVSADPNRLQQVFWNLLNNAIKFTPRGGHIHIIVVAEAGLARAHVEDNGKGVDKAFLPLMFEPFRQAEAPERSHEGLGLGLAISRDLIALLGGTIAATSRGEGHGTRLTVELPLATQAQSSHMPIEEVAGYGEAQLRPLNGIRVMVVDDDNNLREAMQLALAREGANVLSAPSGDAALAILAATDGATYPHVLLSDLKMPGMDGFALLKRVRSLELARDLPKVAAALLTSFARADEGSSRLLAAGFSLQLDKPVSLETLLYVVEELAARAPAPVGATNQTALVSRHQQ